MKPICSFCHVGDHIRLNYPILASKKKTRYQCGSSDNLRTAYPLAPWNKRKQRPRLENEENKSDTSSQGRNSITFQDFLPTKTSSEKRTSNYCNK